MVRQWTLCGVIMASGCCDALMRGEMKWKWWTSRRIRGKGWGQNPVATSRERTVQKAGESRLTLYKCTREQIMIHAGQIAVSCIYLMSPNKVSTRRGRKGGEGEAEGKRGRGNDWERSKLNLGKGSGGEWRSSVQMGRGAEGTPGVPSRSRVR